MYKKVLIICFNLQSLKDVKYSKQKYVFEKNGQIVRWVRSICILMESHKSKIILIKIVQIRWRSKS